MIFDLSPAIEMIRVTAQYSNAVLVAVLPHIADVSHKLNLPCTIATTNVIECSIKPSRRDGNVGVEVGFKGNWYFQFDRGYVRVIQGPGEFFTIQDFDKIPAMYGLVRMSKAEAVDFARGIIKKLGIPMESVFAEQEPRVTEPPQFGTNTVPHYRVQWLDPRSSSGMFVSVDMDINAEAKRVERIAFSNKSLERPPPKLSVVPPQNSDAPELSVVNPEYARQLVPFVLRAINEYAQKLALPVTLPVTTNQIARFRVTDNDGTPDCDVDMTNGWRFLYENARVSGYTTSDDFFTSQNRPILIKNFVGPWKIDEKAAIGLVESAVAKLKYPTNALHFEKEPEVQKPLISTIPRFMLRWSYSRPEDQFTRSMISAEVDANKAELKSLYCADISFAQEKPPIEVPISSPRPEREGARRTLMVKPTDRTNVNWKVFQPTPPK
ncbi:MAG TPA: hypothetical protein VG938_18805 [Verrucomicrobiae bacterium]|jgi:hypothetical protein|nr:hypothetical protein [Verrucomicrobiae bacterium]